MMGRVFLLSTPHSVFRHPVILEVNKMDPCIYLIILMTLAFIFKMSFRDSFGLAAADGREQ